MPVSQFAVLKYSDKKAIQFLNRLDKKIGQIKSG